MTNVLKLVIITEILCEMWCWIIRTLNARVGKWRSWMTTKLFHRHGIICKTPHESWKHLTVQLNARGCTSAYGLKENCHGGSRDPDHARNRTIRRSNQRGRFAAGSHGVWRGTLAPASFVEKTTKVYIFNYTCKK